MTLAVGAALLTGLLVAACWRSPVRGWALAASVGLAAVLGTVLARTASRMFPLFDIAVLQIYAREALAGRLLVGPYSRFQWHHPGPLYFYVLAPFYAGGAHQTAALAAGAAAVAVASIALLAWLGARAFGPVATTAILGVTVAYLWRVPDLATSPWNPHVVVLPTVALIAAGAVLASGDLAALPVVVALASFVVQTDVALVPVAGAVALTACVLTWRAAARSTLRASGTAAKGRLLIGSVSLAAILWALPIVEEIRYSPGNLTLLWRFFVSDRGQGQTFRMASAAWAAMLAGPFQPGFSLATGGTFVRSADGAPLTIALAGFVAAVATGVWAGRSARPERRALGRLAWLAALATAIALWSVTHIEGGLMDHEVFWLSGIGVLNAGVALGAAILAVHDLLGWETRPAAGPVASLAAGLLMAATLWIGVVQIERARAGSIPVTLTSPAAERLGASLGAYLRDHGVRRPLVTIGEDVWGMTAGVLLELDSADTATAVEDDWLPMFPRSFAATGAEDARVSFTSAEAHAALARRPGNVAIAEGDGVFVDAVPLAPNGR